MTLEWTQEAPAEARTEPFSEVALHRPIRRVAVLNRGEAAMRFLRALREYNFEHGCAIKSVAFVTTPDAHAPFVRMADEFVSLGPPFITDEMGVTCSAYCHHATILEELKAARCDAVWPGWGFVSEDAAFVAKLEAAGILFIGPSAASMRQLGDKIASKVLAEAAGVPLAPWADVSDIEDPESLLAKAETVGYPLMVKASAGGGGRGIRKVKSATELLSAIAGVRDDVTKVFGEGGVFLERCVTNARHIEVQLVVGADGIAASLGVRDCSIQRRNQKVIEESPSPVISPQMAKSLCDAAERLVEKAAYRGVGTAEFLVQTLSSQEASNGGGKEHACFLEVNSRLQVEHTVTELITGVDLVKAQIDIAQGKPWLEPSDATSHRRGGHAIEVRLNAENPERDFCPSPGKLQVFRAPFGPGIRVDNGVIEGMEIAPQFDSMIAKVIAWAPTRKQAIARLTRALQELEVVIEDGTTNKAFLLKLLGHEAFVLGHADTTWLDGAVALGELRDQARSFEALFMAAILEYRRCWRAEQQRFFSQVQNGIPQGLQAPVGRQIHLRLRQQAWRLSAYALGNGRYRVGTEDALHDVSVEFLTRHSAVLTTANGNHQVLFAYGRTGMAIEIDGAAHAIELASSGRVKAPSPAMVVHIAVEEGATVAAGELLCTLEAMKMEMPVYTRESGVVRSILCRPNQQVHAGQALILLEPTQSTESDEPQTHQPLPPAPPKILDRLFEQHLLKPDRLAGGDTPQSRRLLHELSTALRSIFLGFDLTPETTNRIDLLFGQDVEPFLVGEAEHLEGLASCIGDALTVFADIEALFEKGLQLRSSNVAEVSPELHFYDFCRRHQEGEEGAAPAFRPLLQQALEWYDVHSLAPTDALREALWRMAVAYTHGAFRHRLCSALMRLLMALHQSGVSFHHLSSLRDTLGRVAHLADMHYPFVADNARQAAYVLFEQSRYVQRQQVVRYHFEKTLSLLAETTPSSPSRDALIQSMVSSRHSLLPLMVRQLQLSSVEGPALAEAILRRLYPEHSFALAHAQQLEESSYVGLLLQMTPTEAPEPRPERHAPSPADALISHHSFVLPACVSRPFVSGLFVAPAAFPWALQVLSQPREQWKQGESGIDCIELVIAGTILEEHFGEQVGAAIAQVEWEAAGFSRLTVSWCNGNQKTHHRTFVREQGSLLETELLRDIHPEAASRIELWRLQAFKLRRLETPEQIYAFQATARENPKDERIFVFAEVGEMPEHPSDGSDVRHLWEFEQAFFEGLRVIREAQVRRHSMRRFHWNSFTLFSHPILDLGVEDIAQMARRFESRVLGLGLHEVILRAFVRDDDAPGGCVDTAFVISKAGRHRLEVRQQAPRPEPIRAMRMYDMMVVKARRRGVTYPYEIVRMLEGQPMNDLSIMPPDEELISDVGNERMRSQPLHPAVGRGHFVEYELAPDEQSLTPIQRPYGQNPSGVVVGVISHETDKHPEGMRRVWIASDPTRSMGSLSRPECLRILAALDLAQQEDLPIEWIPISAGARIAMDSGTENLDWTARVLRRIIEFTRDGGEIHLIIDGVNVGAQSYWNAEATMLMHTKGALIMTPSASMVLTGKKALEVSGSVSAEDERGIGGFERIMGPNGQAQYAAADLAHAYRVLFEHYQFTYRAPGEAGPRPLATQDPIDRSILDIPYEGTGLDNSHFLKVGDIFDEECNPGRKKPFAIREVMRAVIDQDGSFLERYQAMRHAETAVVWDAHMGGLPICMIGFESHPQARSGRIPIDGPDTWTGGTLYPQGSKKVAWAINAASGNRPIVVLANLSGFDGSPESLRKLQLEMGAEIGRAVVAFQGPMVFVVIGRYHGGAYVVFSKALNPHITALALEGTFASVIGGSPAAAVVFPHTAARRAEKDPRMIAARDQLEASPPDEKPHLREKLGPLQAAILLEKQGEIAKEFDAIHTVERAVSVGSIDAIIKPIHLRSSIIEIIRRSKS